jgi:aminopeptidase N
MRSWSRIDQEPRPAAGARRGRMSPTGRTILTGRILLVGLFAATCQLALPAARPAQAAPVAGTTVSAAPPGAASTAVTAASTAAAPLDVASLGKAIDAAALDPAGAVAVNHLALSAGPARVELTSGVLIPAARLGGRTIELVFVGAGRVTLDPPDAIEASQLDLFTARPRLDENVTAAVLVLGLDSAAASLLRRPASAPGAADLATAQELFAAWKKRERRVMGVEGRILSRAAGDPALAGYFAALCRGARLGEFLYVFDPQAQEQVTLGRFVPLDPTAKQKKELLKELAREQRKGRLMGMDLDELGTWDTWVGASPRDAQGRQLPGAAAFEPRLYELDTTLARDLRLSGRARIELVPVLEGARTVDLRLDRNLTVSRVSLDAPGAAGAATSNLPFRCTGGDLTVVLPRAFGKGEIVGLTVEYAGSVIQTDDGASTLLTTTAWYPHAGEIDRARYTATFHWPRSYTLLASGHRLAGGDASGGQQWEKRAIEQPTVAFSFEIGKFRLQTVQAGHVRITIGLDQAVARLLTADVREQIQHTAADALSYYETVFGPYPFDELAVATSLRDFSQGTQGLVTLSDAMLLDFGFYSNLYGLPDRRAVIAHELAHQWWGDGVGWASYRDQWISEALASYCALRYIAHAGLDHEVIGLTAQWQQTLTDTIAQGRDVESIGPVVLGARLSSSLSSSAYEAIVYDKGTVVLKTLEATLGPDAMLRALVKVYQQNLNQTLSTQDLVSQLGAAAGTDLSAFADQFIYGTGLRTILYSYHFKPLGAGTFQVAGTTRQETPRHYRYRVVRSAAGALDVQREAIRERAAAAPPLAVPADIEVVDPLLPPAKKGAANATVHGRFWVRGQASDFAIEVHGEPKAFYLDRQAEVFARFYDEQRHPRLSLLVAARIAADQDQAADAESLLAKALATDDKDESNRWYEHGALFRDHGQTQRLLTVEIQLSRARLFLQQGRDADAKAALDGAGEAGAYQLGDDRDLLLAWLDIHLGHFDSAFRRLRDSQVDSAEATLLLAIAAQATGHHQELEAALKAARRQGADATLLQPAAAAGAAHVGVN